VSVVGLSFVCMSLVGVFSTTKLLDALFEYSEEPDVLSIFLL
jgi:hypothetical protein